MIRNHKVGFDLKKKNQKNQKMKSSLLTDMRTCPLSPVFALETQKHLGRVSFFPAQRAPVAAFVVPKDRGKTVTGLRKKKKEGKNLPDSKPLCVFYAFLFIFLFSFSGIATYSAGCTRAAARRRPNGLRCGETRMKWIRNVPCHPAVGQ